MLPIDKLGKNDMNPSCLLSKISWEAWDLWWDNTQKLLYNSNIITCYYVVLW